MSRMPITNSREETRRLPAAQLSPDTAAFDTDDEPRLAEYRDILLDHKWLICAVMGVALLAAIAYTVIATPVYRGNLLLQIEDSAPESKSFLTDTTGLGELKTTAAGEIQVLGSRMVIGAAVDKVGLQVSAEPRYLPMIGPWLARRADDLSNPGFLGFGGYVSGTERIAVSRFSVPPQFEDTAAFTVTAQGDGRYTVNHELLDGPLNGVVGQPLRQPVGNGFIDIQIAELAGKSGAEFNVAVASRVNAIERLQQRLLMSEQGKQSNVVSVALEDSDRDRLSLVLNAIAAQYVQQNMDRKSAEAEKTLSFLNAQLPVFERQLKASEDAYARFRNQHGTVAFDEEARVWLKNSSDLQMNLLELKQNRLDLTRINNNSHPKVQTLNQQIAAVESQIGDFNKKIAAMPNIQRDALRLERDMRANSAQYQSMQNNALQMRLLKEGKVGNVRLLDNAMVSKAPIKPQKSLIVALALVLGALIGPALAIFLTRSKGGIQNPGEVSANTGLELYGVIPQSPEQSLLKRDKEKGSSGELLADTYPYSQSIEALRGLRVGLKLALDNAQNNRILITGPTPGIGKSFIATNFAMLLAQTGKRILMIDADLRKGGNSAEFGLSRERGLSDVLDAGLSVEDAIRKNVRPNLDVLTTGKLPRHPSDMLESNAFIALLDQLSASYDHVVIDTTPILFAADAVAIAPACGCVLLVAKAGNSELKDLKESIRRLAQAGAPVDGLLLNGMDVSRRYGGTYGSKSHDYRYAAPRL